MGQLHTYIERNDYDALEAALLAGADINEAGHCDATPLMAAIEQKSERMFDLLLKHGADPDITDTFNDTALHAAATHDWAYAVRRLIERGMDLGRQPKYPLKEVDYDMGNILKDIQPEPMPEDMKEFMDEEEWIAMNTSTDFLSDLGKNPEPKAVIKDAHGVEVLQLLLDAGERLEDADEELRRQYIGLPAEDKIDCDKAAYLADRFPRFGASNPEPVSSPYMQAMVYSGGQAYAAREKFADETDGNAVWCYQRHGHSLTPLPDGRFVGIAGEHEDYYDPDFYIYNDVFIHDGQGGVDIFLYPKDVFPPTDFHTATLVNTRIYIIGSLGYMDERQPGMTPVYALDLETMAITQVPTTGAGPGWISRHYAKFDSHADAIRISGGVVWCHSNENGDLQPNTKTFILDLHTMNWSVLSDT